MTKLVPRPLKASADVGSSNDWLFPVLERHLERHIFNPSGMSMKRRMKPNINVIFLIRLD